MKKTLSAIHFFETIIFSQAAPFYNLDFRAADTSIYFRTGATGAPCICDILPGWAVFGSTNSTFFVNFPCADEGCGNLFTISYLSAPNPDIILMRNSYYPYPLRGYYYFFSAPLFSSPSFTQRGEVPAGAIHVAADAVVQGAAQFQIALNGVVVYAQGSSGVGVITNADISSLVGKTVDLEVRLLGFNDPFAIPHIGLGGVAFVIAPQINTVTPKLSTNGFTCSWTNSPIIQYQVESTTNVTGVWQPIGSTITSTNGTFTFTDTNATAQTTSQRFYRLRVVQ